MSLPSCLFLTKKGSNDLGNVSIPIDKSEIRNRSAACGVLVHVQRRLFTQIISIRGMLGRGILLLRFKVIIVQIVLVVDKGFQGESPLGTNRRSLAGA